MIRNEAIRYNVGVASMMDKMKLAILRWFGQVKRSCTYVPLRRCERLAIVGIRSDRGRSKKFWRELLRYDMTYMQLTEDMTLDRKIWRSRVSRSECF